MSPISLCYAGTMTPLPPGQDPFDSPVCRALYATITEPFEGTASDLLRMLRGNPGLQLPAYPQQLSRVIDRIAPDMAGWSFSRKMRGTYQLWVIVPAGWQPSPLREDLIAQAREDSMNAPWVTEQPGQGE